MPSKVDQLTEGIKSAMEHADEWEKRKTSIPGIYLVRMPEKDLRVMLMFNPPDDDGNPTRKKGMYFADQQTVDAARHAFPNPGLDALIEAIGRINQRAGKKEADEAEVFKV
jgi:hypothetical protein